MCQLNAIYIERFHCTLARKERGFHLVVETYIDCQSFQEDMYGWREITKCHLMTLVTMVPSLLLWYKEESGTRYV